MAFLKRLTEIATPDLVTIDPRGIEDEIIATIQGDPDYANNFRGGELQQSAHFTIISTVGYIASKVLEALNRAVREGNPQKARTPRGVIDSLAAAGVQIEQPSAAVVQLQGEVLGVQALPSGLTIPYATTITGRGLNDESVPIELLRRDLLDQSQIAYLEDIEIQAGPGFFTVDGFAGTSRRYDTSISAPDNEGITLTLPIPDVIGGSIRAYAFYDDPIRRTELIKSDTLVVEPVPSSEYPDGVPHYVEEPAQNGGLRLLFGTSAFGGAFSAIETTPVTVFYRTGGGAFTNVEANTINQVVTFNPGSANEVRVRFTNPMPGSGGSNRESLLQAQRYAPYRTGRGRAVVTDQDALSRLRSQVVKHDVQSPRYSPLGLTVPILHTFNYIVPKRSLAGFTLPAVNAGDTLSEYKVRLEEALNQYLNLQGLHDGPVAEELASLFSDSDFIYRLLLKSPLSPTVRLSAYDHDGIEVDRLEFVDPYIGSIAGAAASSKATATAQEPAATLTIDGTNNQIRLLMDDPGSEGGPGTGVAYTVTIPGGLYGADIDGRNTAIAAALDTAIRNIDPWFTAFTTHTFASVDAEGKVTITSPTPGRYSRVRLEAVANSAYEILGFDPLAIPFTYRAVPSSGRVFDGLTSSLTIDPVDGTTDITAALVTDLMEQSEEYDPLLTVWPNVSSVTGPTIDFQLLDENGVPEILQIGKPIIVRAYDSLDVLIDEVTFASISEAGPNVATLSGSGTGDVIEFSAPATLFDYATSTVTLKLRDSDDLAPPYDFPAAYGPGTYFIAEYERKTYKFVGASYTPSPYQQEGEALELISRLRARDSRMQALEPLPKRVKFVPQKLVVQINVRPGASRARAISDASNIILENLGYDNENDRSQVGQGLNVTDLEAQLSSSLNTDSINSALVTNTRGIADPDGNRYYFVLDPVFIARLTALEASFPQVAGLAGEYRTDIIAV